MVNLEASLSPCSEQIHKEVEAAGEYPALRDRLYYLQ